MSIIGSGIPLTPARASVFGATGALSRVNCPKCGRYIEASGNGATRCGFCGWAGEIYLFNPLPITVEHSEQALAEDATCLHHPAKKAVAVCAGTGDYICALCAVDLNGETYSTAYLNTAGKDKASKASKAFARYLERPDSTIITLIILCFVPYVNFVFAPGSIFWLPYAFYLYVKALRMRNTDPLFARVMGMGRVIVIPILLGLFSLGWIFGLAAIIIALASR